MKTLGGLLARKTLLPDSPAEPEHSTDPQVSDGSLDLDDELFSAHAAQLGAENEALRNLLIDASAKIDELDTIKSAVGRLVDPISKALRQIEVEKAEKAALQSVLNNTRAAYGKLRGNVADLERRAATAEADSGNLRQELAGVTVQLKTAENGRAELAIDVAGRRAQIADLEGRLGQETVERRSLTEEVRRLGERLVAAEKRGISLESDLNGTRQRLLIADDEKRAHQSMLDRASGETAQLTRRVAELESSLNATQSRLRQIEASHTELTGERDRLTAALDETKEKQDHELTSQRMRFEALQARSLASEKLLGDAREHLLARAEEIRNNDRCIAELAMERDTLQARLGELEVARIGRESALHELEQARASLSERLNGFTRAFAAKEAAMTRAEETITALNERIAGLEQALADEKHAGEHTLEEMKAALRRERMERSVVEGALETARKDFSRAMRDLMALQRQQNQAEAVAAPRAANAA